VAKNIPDEKTVKVTVTAPVYTPPPGPGIIYIPSRPSGFGSPTNGGSGSPYGNGPGYGGGGSSSSSNGSAPLVPPSCKSFNYRKTSSNWQEAGVKGIYFHIVLLSNKGIKHKYRASIPHLYFGAPLKDRKNRVFESGAVEYASARALNEAMSITARTFANTKAPQSRVDDFFRKEVKNKSLYLYQGQEPRIIGRMSPLTLIL